MCTSLTTLDQGWSSLLHVEGYADLENEEKLDLLFWKKNGQFVYLWVDVGGRMFVYEFAELVVLAGLNHHVLFQCCADTYSLACFYSLCFSLSFFIPFSSSSHNVIKQNKLSSLRSARRLVLFTYYPPTVCHLRWDFSSRGLRVIPAKRGSDGCWLHARPCPAALTESASNLLWPCW